MTIFVVPGSALPGTGFAVPTGGSTDVAGGSAGDGGGVTGAGVSAGGTGTSEVTAGGVALDGADFRRPSPISLGLGIGGVNRMICSDGALVSS